MTGPDEEDIPLPDEPGTEESLPPHNREAEQSVLGALMLSLDAIEAVGDLQGEDFYVPAHQTIYETILALYAQGTPTDAVSVMAALDQRGVLLRVGGGPYLHTLIANLPTAANAGYYAELVADTAVRRRLVETGKRITQLGHHGDGAETDEIVERAREAVEAAVTRSRRDTAQSGAWLGDLLDERVDTYTEELTVGMTSGWADLDEVINGGRGLLDGQLVYVAARPGVGKSLLVIDWLKRICQGGVSGLLNSLEMTRGEIGDRMVAAEGRVGLSKIIGHTLDDEDHRLARAAVDRLRNLDLRVEDTPHMGLGKIRALARDMARQPGGLGVIGVDYIQLMTAADERVSRQEQISAFSRGLKILAKDFCPVICAAQLNRGPENRPDKKPQLSDLRESGSLEQDADIVILLYRPEDHPDEIWAVVAKNRNGPSGMTIRLGFIGQTARITNLPYPYPAA